MYSKEVDIVLRTVFAALICLNITGNILVCLVVRRFPFMKTPMNYLLVHLAVCDMLVGLFLFPRHVLYGLYEHPDGLTGDLLCKFLTYGDMAWLFSCASVYTLVIVAWERYNAIMKPLKIRMSKKYLKSAIVLCWVLAVSNNITRTVVIAYNLPTKSCDYVWFSSWLKEFDGVLWLFTVCFFPFLIMVVLYGRVTRSLWFHKGDVDVSRRTLHLSRKRITKIAVTVTIIFFLCFMPNSLHYFITSMLPENSSKLESFETALPVFVPVSHLLLLLNSSINPVIYALQSKRFRKCMSHFLYGGLRKGQQIGNSFELRSRES